MSSASVRLIHDIEQQVLKYGDDHIAIADAPLICDMAMLIRRLSRIVNRHDPGNTTSANAIDYLNRKGLTGNILRTK